jgi:hypothetical protein
MLASRRASGTGAPSIAGVPEHHRAAATGTLLVSIDELVREPSGEASPRELHLHRLNRGKERRLVILAPLPAGIREDVEQVERRGTRLVEPRDGYGHWLGHGALPGLRSPVRHDAAHAAG